MQSRRSSFIDNFDLDPVWILEIDGIVVRRVVRICFGTTIQNFNLSWLQEVIDERINHVCGANTKSNVTQAGTLAVKFRLLVSTLCHLNAEIGMPVSGIKVVAIGVDLEIQKGQQVFPENKGFVFGREVNSDMPKCRFHTLTVPSLAGAPQRDCPASSMRKPSRTRGMVEHRKDPGCESPLSSRLEWDRSLWLRAHAQSDCSSPQLQPP